MSRISKVTAENFNREVLLCGTPVVVDVYADWCGPCRALAPLLERLADAFEGRVKVLKVNIDEEQEIAEAFQVEGVPTLLFFSEGRLVDQVVGLVDPRELVAKFNHVSGAFTA